MLQNLTLLDLSVDLKKSAKNFKNPIPKKVSGEGGIIVHDAQARPTPV